MDIADRNRRVLKRRGISMPEVLVAVTIVAILSAILIPTVYGRLETARVDALVLEMKNLQKGVELFHRDVGRYPLRLDYLNVLPSPGAVLDACGAAISAQGKAKFKGPYISRSIVMVNPGGGITKFALATGDTVESAIRRTTDATAGGSRQVLQILFYGPKQATIDKLEADVDGTVDATRGILRWVNIAFPSSDTLKWTIPISTGAC